MALYLLFRSGLGFALFEANGLDAIGGTVDAVRRCVCDPNRFRRVVNLAAFRPYGSLVDTFSQVKAVTEGILTEELRIFLDVNLPRVPQGQQADYRLGAVEKLRQVISQATSIPCVSNELVTVLLRGVLLHFDSLLEKEKYLSKLPLPFTVFSNILTRLPIKTLLRFRLACKQWESLICDRKFKVSQESYRPLFTVLCRTSNNLRFYSTTNQVVGAGDDWAFEETSARLDLPYLDYYAGFIELQGNYQGTIFHNTMFPLYPGIQHVHGLVITDSDEVMVIYNPTTRETLKLPHAGIFKSDVQYEPLSNQYFMFPAQKTFLHYDPVSNEYSCLHLGNNDGWLEAQMMKLGDSAWKKLTLPDQISWSRVYSTQAYLNGWLYVSDCSKIMRFNSSSETFEFVCYGPYEHSNVPFNEIEPFFLFVYKGKLAITTHFRGRDEDLCLYTLDMASEEEIWTRMDFELSEATAEILKRSEKRGITANGELILVSPVFTNHNVIHYFNPENGHLNTFHAEIEGMIDMDPRGVELRGLLHINHVDNHLRFLKP